jgi:hypothetical protein
MKIMHSAATGGGFGKYTDCWIPIPPIDEKNRVGPDFLGGYPSEHTTCEVCIKNNIIYGARQVFESINQLHYLESHREIVKANLDLDLMAWHGVDIRRP